MILNGAQILLECFKEFSIDTIFGYPGGAVIPFYDALYDEQEYFKHIRTAHEQAAVHGADGYARTTGKVGVCVVTSGPGATNAVTGIATAYMDSSPIVIISGQVPTSLLGRDSFQEIDITGVTSPITKCNYIVTDIEELEGTVRRAFYIATSGRPGPVLIDIPKDIFLKEKVFKKDIKTNKDVMSSEKEKINYDRIKEVAKVINESCRPVIYAGGGIKLSNASDNLYRLAQKSQIPVVNSLMGLGTIDREDKLSLGLVGMHGFREANLAITNSDVVIAIGTRFSDRAIGKSDKFAEKSKIIQIDIDETEIDKNILSHLPLIGDVNHILKELLNYVKKNSRKKWIDEIERYKLNNTIKKESFHPKNILKEFNKLFNEDSIVATDVGQHQLWTAQFWRFKSPRNFVTSGGLGTMGFGLGAAIGSKVANPNKRVLLITGDGSFGMNCNELTTVAKYKLPITILLMNNNTLGMVRQWQCLFNEKRYSETDIDENVDYMQLVKAYGIKGFKVRNIEELKSILLDIKDYDGPSLVECIIDKDEGVFPIIPPGKAIDQLVLA